MEDRDITTTETPPDGGAGIVPDAGGSDLAVRPVPVSVPKGTQPLFREVQRLAEYRIWLPIALIVFGAWYEFLRRFFLEGRDVTHSVPDWVVLLLTVIFGIGAPVFGLFAMRLVTEVYPGILTVRMTPFPRARLQMATVKMALVREYSAIKEYRGWGVKVNRRNGRAYTARGNQGVQMVLLNGSLLLIGSQEPQKLLSSLRAAGAEFDEAAKGHKKRARKPGATSGRPKS